MGAAPEGRAVAAGAEPDGHGGWANEDTLALRALNLKMKDDPRFDISMLTVGDGLTLARKR